MASTGALPGQLIAAIATDALARFVIGDPVSSRSRQRSGTTFPALTELRTGGLSTGLEKPTKSHRLIGAADGPTSVPMPSSTIVTLPSPPETDSTVKLPFVETEIFAISPAPTTRVVSFESLMAADPARTWT